MKHAFTISMLVGLAIGALEVDLDSPDSIKRAAKLVAADLLSYYHGNEPGQIVGILPPPPDGYFWWQAGAMWGTLIDYWHYSGDSTYNNWTQEAMLWQADPPRNSFMPINWTSSLGNDDQGFWGMSAMLAAEVNFPNPPPEDAQWLALAQAVFNTQAPRWDTQFCGGGLRWQIIPSRGYDYKNTIANGIMFNMGARLARYTLNETYAQWASKSYDWMVEVGYIDSEYKVYDGAHIDTNCTGIDHAQFSYNAAVVLQGAAFMYNYTNGSDREIWRTRLDGLVNRTIIDFFAEGAAIELPCELPEKTQCNTDQYSFKGYMHRWMATTTQIAPYTRDKILPVLRNSTANAVKTCTGGANGRQCGFSWTKGTFDGLVGVGQQMNALAALSSLIVGLEAVSTPVTNNTGGTSIGDPSAGQEPDELKPLPPPTGADKAGASILTIVAVLMLTAIFSWMGMKER